MLISTTQPIRLGLAQFVRGVQPLVTPILAAHLVFPLLWLLVVTRQGPRADDWQQFKIVADQFVAGSWEDLYSTEMQSAHPGFFWRYPPYALYIVAPLAWISAKGAYFTLAMIEIAAIGVSLWLLATIAPPRGARLEWTLSILMSAPVLTTIIAGQISGLLLLCLTSAAMLLTRGREAAAFSVLGLLALKPNIGVVVGCYALVRRQWRGVGIMAAVVSVLCASTIPLGWELWADFIRASLSNVNNVAVYENYKLITLQGFLGAVLPARVAMVVWTCAALALFAIAAWAWLAPGPPARHFGSIVLLAIAANPYGFFYDALLLAIPGSVWWSERDRWRCTPWRFVGCLILAAWCWEQSAYTWPELLRLVGLKWMPPFSLVGPVAAIWLCVAAREARSMAVRRVPQPDQKRVVASPAL